MRISFELNGESVSVETAAHTRLIEILRKDFGLTGARPGCLYGTCGFCSILFNGELALSCMIPAFRVENGAVTTIEGFLQSREFRDIEIGFHRAGTIPCRFCSAAKVLTTHWLISRSPSPTAEQLQQAVDAVQCRCTTHSRFASAIRYSAEVRRKRVHGRKR